MIQKLKDIKDIQLNNISKVVVWQVLGSAFSLMIGLLSVYVFARLLTTSDYGQITTFSAWTSILTIIVGLQVGGSIGVAKKKFENLSGYCSSVIF